ncbi:hypothetical protein Ancab_021956 [Ancistrocladus abbreviatus]
MVGGLYEEIPFTTYSSVLLLLVDYWTTKRKTDCPYQIWLRSIRKILLESAVILYPLRRHPVLKTISNLVNHMVATKQLQTILPPNFCSCFPRIIPIDVELGSLEICYSSQVQDPSN